ncbi:MAG TPA: DUF748 domain-containing protein [Nevskiaceae bacterium]
MGTATRVGNILWGSWWRRVLVVVVVLVGLYAALGFLAVPAVLQWQVPKQVAKYTTGAATIGKVRFNPFTFDLQADDFTLRSAQRQTLLHFAHLDINYNPMQFARRRIDFGWIHVDAPSISASIDRDGKLNFAALLKPDAKSRAAKPQDKKKEELPLVFIDDLRITNGHIAYADQSQGRDFHTALDAINLHLTNLSTEPDSHGEYRLLATIGTDQKLAWHGTLGLNPLRSKGQLDISGLHLAQFWPYVSNRFKVVLSGGTLDVGTQYAMRQGDHGLELALHEGKIALTKLALTRVGGGDPLVSIPKLDVGGLDFDLARRTVDIASVQSTGGRVRGVLDKQHQLDLVTLLMPASGATAPTAERKPTVAAPPMAIKVADVAIHDYRVALTDDSTARPTHLIASDIALQVQGYSSANDKPVSVQADLNVNGGKLHAAGSVELKPLAAQMQFKLAGLQLDSFQSYVEPFARIVIKDGVLGADGKLSYRQQDKTAEMSFDGDASVSRLNVDDARDHQPLVRLAQLSLAGIRYRNHPAGVAIHTVTLDKPFGRLIIAPDHSTNISDVLIHEAPKAGAPAKAAPAGKSGRGTGAMPITIDQIKVQQGAMRFTDHSLTPNVSLGIQHLDGGIDGFTTRPGHAAKIDLQGDVGAFAPISIKGSINPLGKQLTADVDAKLKNLELTAFSPYSGKFAGYQIKKGKVNLDLAYKIHNGLMQGQNSVVIDQLELGNRVDSPDAVSLPLRLAVALLKNADGVISLDLPVHGDLNDPQFSIGPLIWKVFVNLITKAVTSPFRLLAGLVEGSGDELDHVSFDAGQSGLSPAEQKSLTTLAGALAKRPNLNLDVGGVAVPALDQAALAKRLLIARLNGEPHVRPGSDQHEALTAEGTKRLLAAYRDQFHKAADEAVPRKPDESKEAWQQRVAQAALAQLVSASPPPPNALERLARARADVVRAYLVNSGHVDPSRIFLIAPNVDAKNGGKDTVRMPLQVQVR